MKKNFWLDVILFLSGVICIVTGIILDFHLVEGGRQRDVASNGRV